MNTQTTVQQSGMLTIILKEQAVIQIQKSFHYPTVMADWFQLNSANSSNPVNLIQNRKNTMVLIWDNKTLGTSDNSFFENIDWLTVRTAWLPVVLPFQIWSAPKLSKVFFLTQILIERRQVNGENSENYKFSLFYTGVHEDEWKEYKLWAKVFYYLFKFNRRLRWWNFKIKC